MIAANLAGCCTVTCCCPVVVPVTIIVDSAAAAVLPLAGEASTSCQPSFSQHHRPPHQQVSSPFCCVLILTPIPIRSFAASYVPCSLPTPPPVTSRSRCEESSSLPLLYLGAARTGRHCFNAPTFSYPPYTSIALLTTSSGRHASRIAQQRHTQQLAYITIGLTPTSTLAQPLTVHSVCETCITPVRGEQRMK